MIALLDGRVKRIHIGVQNPAALVHGFDLARSNTSSAALGVAAGSRYGRVESHTNVNS
jgi:hypothetical protein